jgi:hypothetical protein
VPFSGNGVRGGGNTYDVGRLGVPTKDVVDSLAAWLVDQGEDLRVRSVCLTHPPDHGGLLGSR